MPQKLRYEIELTQTIAVDPPGPWEVRPVTPDDVESLAHLMLESYKGTIDYDGEDLDDARREVRSYLEDESSMLDHSCVVEVDGVVATAVLTALVDDAPFISYVMTLPEHKQRGWARFLTLEVLHGLAEAGHARVVLYITEGNRASEALFRSVGAVRA